MFLYNRAKQLQGCYKGCLGVISWRSMINGCRKNALVRRRFALAVCTKQPKIYCIRKRINKKDDVCWTMFNRIFRFSPSAHQGRTHGPAALQQNQYSNNPDSQFFDRSLLIYLLIQISMWTFRRSVSVAIPLSDTLTKGRLCVRRAAGAVLAPPAKLKGYLCCVRWFPGTSGPGCVCGQTSRSHFHTARHRRYHCRLSSHSAKQTNNRLLSGES